MTDRKPLWPFLTATLVGVPVLYVASFGPACWAVDRGFVQSYFVGPVYAPLARVVVRGCPEQMGHALWVYGKLASGSAADPCADLLIARAAVLGAR